MATSVVQYQYVPLANTDMIVDTILIPAAGVIRSARDPVLDRSVDSGLLRRAQVIDGAGTSSSSVWAGRGAGSYVGQQKLMTDIGPAPGTLMRWDGTFWKLMTSVDIVFDIVKQTAALGTTLNFIKQNTIPAGLLAAGRYIIVRIKFAKTGTTDGAAAVRLYIGTLGTSSDTQIFTGAGFSNANQQYATETWLIMQAVTTLRSMAAGSLAQGFTSAVSTTADPQDFTIPDYTTNALIVSAAVQMGASTNAGQVAEMIIQLAP